MTRPEKEELLVEAKTWELAQKYGRHRVRYERMKSPPGFWRTDFPTSQEILEDRKKAEEIEMDVIKDRWREAMRPNGRWLFRDE